MSLSLYDIAVRAPRQTLGAMQHFLQKGLDHAMAHGIDLAALVEARLYDDMLPLRFQVETTYHFTVHPLKALETGEFAPVRSDHTRDYAALQTHIAHAIAELDRQTPEEINAHAGKDVTFRAGERVMPFTAEDFILGFTMPNVHFHASIAYGILRHKGVPLGKRDFMGQVPLKA